MASKKSSKASKTTKAEAKETKPTKDTKPAAKAAPDTEAFKNGRVYLSGPVTGIPRDRAVEAFEAAHARLRELGATSVMVPTRAVPEILDHERAMLVCLGELTRSTALGLPLYDAVVLLDGWRDSEGARVEATVASALGIPCVDVEGNPVDVGAE